MDKHKYLIKSDKYFWHRFIPVYDEVLGSLTSCEQILEFGVFKGESVRWLNTKFPNAKIHAADILEVKPEWPQHANINYYFVDQGKKDTISNLFQDIKVPLDLIIEDGSHKPDHQKNCLIESLKHIRSGGIYILEDLHTSYPKHPFYKKLGTNYIGPFHLLLAIEQLLSLGKQVNDITIKSLAKNSLFNKDEVIFLFSKIDELKIFKRATLPLKCYRCGSEDFNYHTLSCTCGIGLLSESDSMTAIIKCK